MKFHKTADTDALFEMAKAARLNSYSPYSGAKIGAGLKWSDGSLFSGCNVENASYGGTICAERTAIFKAVSEKGVGKILEMVVVSDFPEAWPPCGLCRQVMAEFSTPETIVQVMSLQAQPRSFKFSELLPEAFGPHFLGK